MMTTGDKVFYSFIIILALVCAACITDIARIIIHDHVCLGVICG